MERAIKKEHTAERMARAGEGRWAYKDLGDLVSVGASHQPGLKGGLQSRLVVPTGTNGLLPTTPGP